MKKCVVSVAVLILCCVTAGCSTVQIIGRSDPLTVLTIGTADSGGTMYPVGDAIAQVLSNQTRKVNVSASSGSSMNVQELLSGEIDLALISGDIAYFAYQDAEHDHGNLQAVAAVYTSVSNWISPIETGAVYVHDLTGMRVGIGPQNSASEYAARIAIDAIGLTRSDADFFNCGLGAGARMVLDDELDALHGFTGAPISGLASLAEQTPCRILRFTTEELHAILHECSFYVTAQIPAGTYTGQVQTVNTFGVKCLLCVRSDADEDLVYSLTRTLWESKDSLGLFHPAMKEMANDTFLYEDLPIPLHSGASKFYQDIQK